MFTITLEFLGKKACVVFNAGDGTDDVVYGNENTCSDKYPDQEVNFLDLENKTITYAHFYK